MNVILNHIPKNWDPHNPLAIAQWMRKLPEVKDQETTMKNDDKYEQKKAAQSI